MKRAALYIRVSTEEQARHGFSLGEQRHDLEQYAREHNYIVVGVYADEGNTARKALSRRRELQRLLADVQAGKVDVILLKCLDRWFRSVKDFYKVQEILDAHGVAWECTQEDYNTTTTNGRLMLNLKLSIAQNESDQTSDRIRYIQQGKIRRGEELTNKHPLGYRIENKKLVINDAEVPIIQFAFSQMLRGSSAHSLAEKIYDKFGISLAARRVWRILRNPTYKGTRYDIEDFCPAIIDAADFDRVQSILDQNQRPAPVKDRIFLFSGKIACPSCGHILAASRGPRAKDGTFRYYVYVCQNRYTVGHPKNSPEACTFSGSISEGVVERYLLANITRLLLEYEAEVEAHNQRAGSYKAKIKTVHDKIQRLKDLYVDGFIDRVVFESDFKKLQSKLQEYSRLATRQAELPELVKTILANGNFVNSYSTMTRAKKRELWQALIKRIEPGPRVGTRYTNFRISFY